MLKIYYICMLSNITLKFVAEAQLGMYEWLNDASAMYGNCTVKLAAFAISTIDVLIDTLKYPIIAIEHIALAAINLFGACCSNNCSITHAWKSLKRAACSIVVATPVMTLLFPLKLFSQYCRTIPDPNHATPSNREAEKEAQRLKTFFVYV